MNQRQSRPIAEPPEGVLAGEDVPMENLKQEFERERIERMMATLKTLGKPFTTMQEAELRGKAVERLRKINGGDL